MTHMFTISDIGSENGSDSGSDVAEAGQSKDKPRDKLATPDSTLTGAALERLRLHSDSQASSASQAEDGESADEGGGLGEGPPLRGRSQSAPPELWAAMRYGRQLRRMSDEFDTLLDEKVMKKVRGAEPAKRMRPSFSWFAFWKRKEPDSDLNSSGSSTDSRSAE